MNKKLLEYNLHIFGPFFIGGAFLYLLNCFFNLVDIFGNVNSYVYYYTFSTIVQGYFALIAFLGALAVFKWQWDEKYKEDNRSYSGLVKKAIDSQRNLTFAFKKCAVVCIWDVGLALIGIPLIPLFNITVFGPIWLGGSIVLSIWVLKLSYPIIQTVLWLAPDSAQTETGQLTSKTGH